MAEKKTTKKAATKKASKQAEPKSVDMVSPVATADETSLELTETKVQENVGVSESEMIDIYGGSGSEAKVIESEDETVASESEPDTTKEESAEIKEEETDMAFFKEDKEIVNDITNILNGLDGVKAGKIGEDEIVEKKDEEKEPHAAKGKTNTEEKNYYSDQFSRSWGGVMYDY